MLNLARFVAILSFLLFQANTALAVYTQAGIVITSPPVPKPTSCANEDLLRRQNSCSFGACGTECLAQGAFCCGPAGTLATSPFWVCDNGACITSVRGSTGIVDCYDPDNPEGTTQSCIDNVPTTTCFSTDRCFTCSTDEPFCFWQTYLAANSPTLRWFSCVSSKIQDATFYAATITGNLTYPNTLAVPTAAPTTTVPTTTSTASPTKGSSPSTGAIIGIAAAGGVALIASVAIIAWCCVHLRNHRHTPPPPPDSAGMPYPLPPVELPPNDQPVDYTGYNQHGLQMSSTAYSLTPSSTQCSPSQYATTGSGDEMGYWIRQRMTEGGSGVAELPSKRASEREKWVGMGEGDTNVEGYDGRRASSTRPPSVRPPSARPPSVRPQVGSPVQSPQEQLPDRGSYVEGDDWDHMTARL